MIDFDRLTNVKQRDLNPIRLLVSWRYVRSSKNSVPLRLFFGYAGKVAMWFRDHLMELCWALLTLRFLFGYAGLFEKYVSTVSRHDGHETSTQSLAGMPDITRSPGLRIPWSFSSVPLRLRRGFFMASEIGTFRWVPAWLHKWPWRNPDGSIPENLTEFC